MDGIMRKIINTVFFLLFLANLSLAQFGLSGGVSMLKGFGGPKPFVGLHISGEIPRDDYVSFFVRAAFYARQKDYSPAFSYVQGIDPSTNPYTQNVTYLNTMNYMVFEGGNRFYIGDGYDNGFGAYGGGTLQAIFNTVKREYNYGTIDMSKYQLPQGEDLQGSIFSLSFGLNGGLKYTFPGYGTAYFETGVSYVLNAVPSNNTAAGAGNLYSPLMFTFGLGFRKEFY
jgi:hypothetical protein